MVYGNQEAKVLVMGGCCFGNVLNDCWLLDVSRGSFEKVMFIGEEVGRIGHSAKCVKLMDGTVVICVFGGYKTMRAHSLISSPSFYLWRPSMPNCLHMELPPAGAILQTCGPPAQAGVVALADPRILGPNTAELQQEIGRLNEQLGRERSRANRLEEEMRNAGSAKAEAEDNVQQLLQSINEKDQLLKSAYAASEAAESRLSDYKQVVKIPWRDVQFSDKSLGEGSFGGVRVGYWWGCSVAVKSLHEVLATADYHTQRFEQEVLVSSRLHHPNITTIFGVTQDGDGPVSMIMELLQATLAEVIQAAKDSGSYLTLREQTDVSHDCLSGLAYLHELVSAQLFYTI
jgi:hypothetical protein